MQNSFGAHAQLEEIDSKIAAYNAEIDDLLKKRGQIAVNLDSWASEPDDNMTRRLRRDRTRLGNREVRFRVTGDRRKRPDRHLPDSDKSTLKVFLHIARKWRQSRSGFAGVALRMADIAKAADCSERWARKIVTDLADRHKVILRLEQSGDVTRYAVTLPETEQYLKDVLLTTFDARLPRLRALANAEAKLPDLEPATSVHLAHLRTSKCPEQSIEQIAA